MLTFFRRIREKLLSENNFSKYLLYAVGEIVLVVIGILIALQINNWNDNRKSRLKIGQILKKAREELALNIANSNDVTVFYKNKEKNLGRVLRQEVTMEDYQEPGLAYLIWNNTTIELSDDSAKELDSFTELLSKEEDSLVLRINELYKEFKPTLDIIDKEIGDAVVDFDLRLKRTTNWYFLSNNFQDLPDKAYDYFLNDTLYLNDVAYYESIGLRDHLRYNTNFNARAKDLYMGLSHYLKMPVDTSVIEPNKRFEHFLGTYVPENQKKKDTIRIGKAGNKLVFKWINGNETMTQSLYPENRDEFVINTWFARLIRNGTNGITGFKLTSGSRPEEVYKKIK